MSEGGTGIPRGDREQPEPDTEFMDTEQEAYVREMEREQKERDEAQGREFR